MKVVFFLFNYAPHQREAINSLFDEIEGIIIHAFHHKTDQALPQINENFYSYDANDFTKEQLFEKAIRLKPDILIVSGWFIKKYVWVSKKIRKRGIPCAAYSDTQWRGTISQRLNSFLSPWHLKKAFSHLWVAGIYQFEYARRLKYSKENILYNSLCCNYELFKQTNLENKKLHYPKNFLFVGRFIPEKGLKYLLEGWKKVATKKDWTLTLVGDGTFPVDISDDETINVKDFKDQDDLKLEMDNAGCFILSSIFEQWGVVLHEASLSGLPIISTNACGANPHFVINGYNGFTINSGSSLEIAIAMQKIINMEDWELLQFSMRSNELGQTINPKKLVANITSILK